MEVAPIGVDLNVYLRDLSFSFDRAIQFLFVSSIVRVLVRTLKSTKKTKKIHTHTHTRVRKRNELKTCD